MYWKWRLMSNTRNSLILLPFLFRTLYVCLPACEKMFLSFLSQLWLCVQRVGKIFPLFLSRHSQSHCLLCSLTNGNKNCSKFTFGAWLKLRLWKLHWQSVFNPRLLMQLLFVQPFYPAAGKKVTSAKISYVLQFVRRWLTLPRAIVYTIVCVRNGAK